MPRGDWGCIVGRTIAGVVTGETPHGDVVYICFDDGTGFEVFGKVHGSSRLRFKSVKQARAEFEREHVPFDVYTEIAPPLDPRDAHPPIYLGIPDPEIVRGVGSEETGGGNDT